VSDISDINCEINKSFPHPSLLDYLKNPLSINQKYGGLVKKIHEAILTKTGLIENNIHTVNIGAPSIINKLIFSAFPKARYIRYDEGSESYGHYIYERHDYIRIILRKFSWVFKDDILYPWRDLRDKYDVNCYCAGVFKYGNELSVSIKDEYKNILKLYSHLLNIDWVKYNNVKLIVPLLNLHRDTHKEWMVTLEAESKFYYEKVVKLCSQKNISLNDVYIKPHPRTSEKDIEKLRKEFKGINFISNEDIKWPLEFWLEKFGPLDVLNIPDSGTINASLIYDSDVYLMDIHDLTSNPWLIDGYKRIMSFHSENTSLKYIEV
jgi:hypothetical protein